MTSTREKTKDVILEQRENWARWNMVNQNDELIIAHLNSATGEAIYKGMEKQWPFKDQRKSGVIPINHVLRYEIGDQQLKVGTTLHLDTQLRLVADWQEDEFRRIHIHGQCKVMIDADEPAGTADYWIALTKPFAPRGQRRLTEIPEALQPLTVHDYKPDDLPLKDLNDYAVTDAQHQRSSVEIFHINQTDMNRHVNTIVYLEIAQDFVAKFAADEGFDVAKLSFRDLEVFYRKPFTAGDRYALELDLQPDGKTFRAAVRFRPLDANGEPEAKIAVGLLLGGNLS